MKRLLTASVLLVLALALGTSTVSGAGEPQKRTVKVEDNFFGPTKLTVNKGSTITFQWPETSDTHDVLLKKGPPGARTFSSPEIAGSSFRYRTKLSRSGRYQVTCTLHETEMNMTITVRK